MSTAAEALIYVLLGIGAAIIIVALTIKEKEKVSVILSVGETRRLHSNSDCFRMASHPQVWMMSEIDCMTMSAPVPE
jgi:hypothetical protein